MVDQLDPRKVALESYRANMEQRRAFDAAVEKARPRALEVATDAIKAAAAKGEWMADFPAPSGVETAVFRKALQTALPAGFEVSFPAWGQYRVSWYAYRESTEKQQTQI